MFKTLILSVAVLFALMTSAQSGAGSMSIGGSGSQASAAYTATAVDFDGTNDFLERAADWTGADDNEDSILSFWYMSEGGVGTNRVLFDSTAARWRFFYDTGEDLDIQVLSTAAGTLVRDTDSVSTPAADQWHHMLFAFDGSVPTCQWYIDDVVETVGDSCNAGTIDGTVGNWFVGALNDDSLRWHGCLAEFYYNQDEFLDMSQESNRRLFNDGTGGNGGGEPVDLGSDGSTPTGTAPILYLRGTVPAWADNAGTGGNMTLTGTLGTCTNSPTD